MLGDVVVARKGGITRCKTVGRVRELKKQAAPAETYVPQCRLAYTPGGGGQDREGRQRRGVGSGLAIWRLRNLPSANGPPVPLPGLFVEITMIKRRAGFII